MTKDTIPEVFIIESLTPDDVENGRREGDLIAHILKMGGRNPIYRHPKTITGFKRALAQFSNSNYRYLHISSHGGKDHFMFHFGAMFFNEFHWHIRHKLANKRVFVSACEAVHHKNHKLANVVLRDTGCYSLIGSAEEINFDTAAMFWSTFYYLVYQNQPEETKFNKALIDATLEKLTGLYSAKINYYSFSRKKGISLSRFINGKKTRL